MNFRITLIISSLLVELQAAGLTITQSPDSLVTRSSIQPIAWTVPSNVTLQMVKIDLYQGGSFRSQLGNTMSNSRTFQWRVSPTARFGNNYFIKVTGTSNQGKVAWANSPSFQIGAKPGTVADIIGAIVGVIVILLICGCCWRRSRRRNDTSTGVTTYQSTGYSGVTADGIPVAQASIATPPAAVATPPPMTCPPTTAYPPSSSYPPPPSYPVVVAQQPPQRQGYSGSTVAGAALAGMVGGAILEEGLGGGHHHHHGGGGGWGGGSSWGGGGDITDFGGGGFGGDQAGDSGGGF